MKRHFDLMSARFSRILLLVFIWLNGSPAFTFADVFELKDKTLIEGFSKEDGDWLVITSYTGDIRRVRKNEVVLSLPQPKRNIFYQKLGLLKDGDAAGHYELALWAKSMGLMEERAQYLKTLEADPFHEGAGKALGYERVAQGWRPKLEDNLVISLKSTRQKNSDGEKGAPERLAQRIVGLSELTMSESQEKLNELISEAGENPAPFERILNRPGARGSANIKDGLVRSKAAFLIGEGGNRNAMEALFTACITEPDPDDRVRRAAAMALARLGEPIAIRKLVDFVKDTRNQWAYRQLACIAMRRYADKEILERLLMELSFELAAGHPQDPKNKMRKGPGGLGTDNPMMLPSDPLPALNPDDRVLYPVLSALREVTGLSLDGSEKDFKTWKIWWQKEKDTFKFNTN